MGKYSNYYRKEEAPKVRKIHPIWRGIGFLLIIIIPFISFIGALILIDENAKRGWYRIPADLVFRFNLPLIGTDPLLLMKIILTLIIMFLIYIVFLLFSFLINSIFGVSGYGPHDAPLEPYRGKPYKR
jgi:hypothetical protein